MKSYLYNKYDKVSHTFPFVKNKLYYRMPESAYALSAMS